MINSPQQNSNFETITGIANRWQFLFYRGLRLNFFSTRRRTSNAPRDGVLLQLIEFLASAFDGPCRATDHATNVSNPAMPSLRNLHRGEATPVPLVQGRGKISQSFFGHSIFS